MRSDLFNEELKNLKITISASALKLMEEESSRAKFTETGGVIAGTGSIETGKVHISHASLPGPRARATRYFFQHDRKYCQKFLDDLAIQSSGKIDYLGEWHKHFELVPRPSGTDVKTLMSIAENSDYHVRRPLLLIIGVNNRSDSLRVFVTDKSRKLIPTDWKKYIEVEENIND